jgi:hypothetical protein
MVTVEVILYKASEQEHRHWAIYFEGPGKKQYTMYQVTGSAYEFAFDKSELEKKPSKSKRFFQAIHVTDALDNPEEAEKVFEQVEIDNESPNWNCQDWVMAALESLKDEQLIPEHDYDNAETQLNNLSGPNDDSD